MAAAGTAAPRATEPATREAMPATEDYFVMVGTPARDGEDDLFGGLA